VIGITSDFLYGSQAYNDTKAITGSAVQCALS